VVLPQLIAPLLTSSASTTSSAVPAPKAPVSKPRVQLNPASLRNIESPSEIRHQDLYPDPNERRGFDDRRRSDDRGTDRGVDRGVPRGGRDRGIPDRNSDRYVDRGVEARFDNRGPSDRRPPPRGDGSW